MSHLSTLESNYVHVCSELAIYILLYNVMRDYIYIESRL